MVDFSQDVLEESVKSNTHGEPRWANSHRESNQEKLGVTSDFIQHGS